MRARILRAASAPRAFERFKPRAPLLGFLQPALVRPARIRKLITLSTPYWGAARAVEQLINGVHKGLGPLAADLTSFARSLPSLYQLVPEYACIEHAGDLAKTTEVTVPELDTTMSRDAMRFHIQLQEAEFARPESLNATHAIVGIRQAIPSTVTIGTATPTSWTPTGETTWPAMPPSPWWAPAALTCPSTAPRCAVSRTSTATCNATGQH